MRFQSRKFRHLRERLKIRVLMEGDPARLIRRISRVLTLFL